MVWFIVLFWIYGKYVFLLAIVFGLVGGIVLGVIGVMSKLYLGLMVIVVIFFFFWWIWFW